MAPDDPFLNKLHRVADDLRDYFSADGHAVDGAQRRHHSFRNGRTRGVLLRSMMVASVKESAHRYGIRRHPVPGDAFELMNEHGHYEDLYRLLRAERRPDGLHITRSKDSRLGPAIQPDDPTLFPLLRRQNVLAVTTTDDNQIDQVVVAEVLRVDAESTGPGRLVLGEEIQLGSAAGTPPPTFRQFDDGLGDFDGDVDGYGFAAS